jgi:hypothetical protein
MEAYKRAAKTIVRRFLRGELSLPKCIAALDAALAEFIPRLTGEQIAHLRAVMLANNETVMQEMARRTPKA